MRRWEAFAVAAFLGLAAMTLAQGDPVDSAYTIGPRDLLEIRVFEEPSLNVERRVTDDGTFNLPLLGNFVAGGLTEAEAASALKTALEESYLQRATVTVQVIEYRSRPISVIGAVNRPGNLEFSGRWSLLEALTEAGGLASDYGRAIHVVRRADNGLTDQIQIEIDDLLVQADPTVNIPIVANDVITVQSSTNLTIYLMGEVKNPGAVTFKSSNRLTLLGAIAQSGGLTKRASSKISVKRLLRDGTRDEIVIGYKSLISGKEPDIELQDGDLILIKESFF